jgi:elongation factor G
VLCGTAFKSKGVQPLLDAAVDYLPAPNDIRGIRVITEEDKPERFKSADDQAPFAGLAFKVINDKYGSLTFVRVYSGHAKTGDQLINTTRNRKERIGRIYQMHANKRSEITEVFAGDICAFVGLKDTTTGDTLSDQKDPVILERMAFPVPVIDAAVEADTKEDMDRMSVALQKLCAEDPSLKVKTDPETAQTILSGMGELHLEIIVDRMKREYDVRCRLGAPQVSYRETITKTHTETYLHKKQTGGSGQYAEVTIRFEPQERGAGIKFFDEVVGGTVPREFIPAVEKGIRSQAESGVLASFPTVDFSYALVDGKFHEVDSSAIAFEIAARSCFREGMLKAGPVLLEPMMEVEVTTPPDHVGDVVGDLVRRRGMIQHQENAASSVMIRALSPLSEMFGYIGDLRSMTKGRASFTMHFAHYEQVATQAAAKILARHRY